MKKLALFTIVMLAAGVLTARAQQPESTIQKVPLSDAQISNIVKKFTDHERDFREALKDYVFSRSATVNLLGMGGQISGTYRRDSEMTFAEDGSRFERIVFFPIPTTPPRFVTVEDLEDLGGVNPFALEPSAISDYNFVYVGKEKIDELNLFVFDVTPKAIPDPKKSKLRLFTGRVWVDDRDLMIVKTKGKAVPETKTNKFPVVETWRENIDGKYWFPSFATSNDELVFDDGSTAKIRMRVKYNNYKLGHTDVKIIGEEEVVPAQPSPSPTPKKP